MKTADDTRTVEPINTLRQQRVHEVTLDYIARAGRIYARTFTPVAVSFDLKGRAAGMYRVQGRNRLIRYNPYIFAKYFDDNLATTVPHEVAHIVVHHKHSYRCKPHGYEWKRVMRDFGVEESRCHSYDTTNSTVRSRTVARNYAYKCACQTHMLTSIRHKKAMRGSIYICKRCKTSIKQVA